MRMIFRWAATKRTTALARRFTGALLALAAVSAPAGAQGWFGQNQVQYDHFKWRVLETEHFQIYYYQAVDEITPDIAKMAERSYARLSVLMGHQFREKKPVLVFGSSGDFAQSNVFGDLGEGTGGVTDPMRQRMAEFMTGDYGSFEHVLQHEMVHVFQFDIFSRGRAGAGIGNLAQVNPPLWFMEGLAEYFSIGRTHPWTNAWIRDAVVNNTLPSIAMMTDRPDKYFPYRFGLSVWQYVGERWGDEVIAEIMNDVPSIGIERSFRRELGVTTAELSAQWKRAMQDKFLPVVAQLDRPRTFAEPLLTQHRSGGNLANLFVAPALSNDGQKIAYIAYGSLYRGEVFPDLYLADANTGKREARLVKSTTDPNFEQLRFIYSQPSFSPDGQSLAFTSQRGGHDIINLMNMKSRDVYKRIDYDIDQVLSPSWSPDGKVLVFSGLKHGVSDLYTVNADGTSLKQLTNDRYGDEQPQWSPDGKTIAFASDRGPDTDLEILKIGKWRISLYNVETGEITQLPNQGGLNINPQWAPDGKSIAFVSDRTGVANLFLYDFAAKEHYQLTNVVGAITAVAEYSPAITWARGADLLAFVYYEKGDHTVWKVANPRALKKAPYRDPVVVAQNGSAGGNAGAAAGVIAAAADTGAAGTGAAGTVTAGQTVMPPVEHLPIASIKDTTATRTSVYRAPLQGPRRSSDLPMSTIPYLANSVSITAMMDSFNFHLPDSTRFRDHKYKVRLMPEYISQPQIGYQQGGFGQGAYGNTTIVLADILGDHMLAIGGSLNGQLSDASVFVQFTNLARRLQYSAGFYTQPAYYVSGQYLQREPGNQTQATEVTEYTRLVIREAFLRTYYPLNRFTRFEVGFRIDNIDQQLSRIVRAVDLQLGIGGDYQQLPTQNLASVTTLAPSLAWVTDNTLGGNMGTPLSGRRIRAQFEPNFGSWQYQDYTLDARRYFPIVFNYLTVATRFTTSIGSGRDEARLPKWIGRTDYIRGYNRDPVSSMGCTGLPSDNGAGCNGTETIGSRVAFANAELRFPLLRFMNSSLPIPLVDGLFFYDAGVAWSKDQTVSWNRPANYDVSTQRTVLKSWGVGARINVFGIAILRYDWAFPLSRPGEKGFGTFSLGVGY